MYKLPKALQVRVYCHFDAFYSVRLDNKVCTDSSAPYKRTGVHTEFVKATTRMSDMTYFINHDATIESTVHSADFITKVNRTCDLIAQEYIEELNKYYGIITNVQNITYTTAFYYDSELHQPGILESNLYRMVDIHG